MKSKKPLKCNYCGEKFNNIFEWTDHELDEDEPYFNPSLILPNGYKFMVGAFLRYVYSIAENTDEVKGVMEATYLALWKAEHEPDKVDKAIHNLIVSSAMQDLDKELKSLLENGQ
jgi:hypothetical protein